MLEAFVTALARIAIAISVALVVGEDGAKRLVSRAR